MDDRIKTLQQHSDDLYQKRWNLMSVWQEMADNFYPQRADFTTLRNVGRDFAALLSTSYPLMVREELGNQFSTMLRPNDQPWFSASTSREDKIDNEGKRWLEWATNIQRRAMYDRVTQIVRATKEGDHDFATFGQCVISNEINRNSNSFLYRCWHLRDVVWAETYDGRCLPVYRKWAPPVCELNQYFKGKLSAAAMEQLKKSPYDIWRARHAIVDASEYESPAGKKWKTPYVSIWWEENDGHILEEIGTYNRFYIIPRWSTVSGSQYAYSPSVVAAMPDARLIQSMTLVLLEAGEKATNPPLVAVQEAIRSDVQVFAGGITWVDAEYDERTGEALRPMNLDYHGIPTGVNMREDIKKTLSDAFYLNKIQLPPIDKEMTAYETGQRIQQYIRNALPLFEPMEMEYNSALCEQTFDLGMRAGLFGDPRNIPASIRGLDIRFTFESPLHKAIEKQKGPTFLEAGEYLDKAIAVDPTVVHTIDIKTALRDVLDGIGAPAKWINSIQKAQELDDAAAKQQQIQQTLATVNAGADTAKKIADAGQALQPITGSASQRVNNLT